MTPGAADNPERRPLFVTGATGYIGGRLVPRLIERGYRVRCYARSAEKVRARSWGSHPHVEIIEGDLFDAETEQLTEAMRGCGAAYYLVHAMLSAGAEYIEQDREMARRFAGSAAAADLERIVYLGGLGELGEDLSRHLASRREVGEVLAERLHA